MESRDYRGQERRNRNNQRSYNRDRTSYNYANTAAQLNEMLEEAPQGNIKKTVRKKKEKAMRMDLKYVMLCMIGLCVILGIVAIYVNLRSNLTKSIERTSNLEKTYVNLRNDNNEEYERILSNVDMDEVKRVAIEELGMHYAKDGQIVVYADEVKDYVRQYSDME